MMPKTKGHILIVDDDNAIRIAAQVLLSQYFTRVSVLDAPEKMQNYIQVFLPDIIVLDLNFSAGKTDGKEGIKWLDYLHREHPDIVVCIITAYGAIDKAVYSVKNGAFDFIVKPWDNHKFVATISAGLQLKDARKELKQVNRKQKDLNEYFLGVSKSIIGEAPAMKAIKRMIGKVAPTPADVLILGANGTGKGLVAKEIHRQSAQSDKAFIHVDLGSLPETLFESELFGYEKGAFTGATKSHPGRFELAKGGTLFLDEIGNLPLHLQSKLLSALQERKIRRLGSSSDIVLEFRLIVATNQSVYQMVKEGLFREDLLYRINTIEINLPALSERPGDIPLLARFFLDEYVRKYHKNGLSFDKRALDTLQHYNWPGNIRELMHSIERAVILCESSQIQAEDLSLRNLDPKFGNMSNLKFNDLEKMATIEALERSKGNVTKAAEMVGISRVSFYRYMKKHGIQ